MEAIKINRTRKGGEVTIPQGNQARWFELSISDLYELSDKLDEFLASLEDPEDGANK